MYYGYYGDSMKVEMPTGSGRFVTLEDVAREISSRLIRIFAKGENGTLYFFGRRRSVGERKRYDQTADS